MAEMVPICQGSGGFDVHASWGLGADGPEIGAHDSTFFWLVRWINCSVQLREYNIETRLLPGQVVEVCSHLISAVDYEEELYSGSLITVLH